MQNVKGRSAEFRPASEAIASLPPLDRIKAEMEMRSMARQWIGPAADNVQIVKQIVDAYGQQMAGVHRGPGLTEIAEAYRGDPDTWGMNSAGTTGSMSSPRRRNARSCWPTGRAAPPARSGTR